jgi:hypothetical protein
MRIAVVQRRVDGHDVGDFRAKGRARRIAQHGRVAQARGQLERAGRHVHAHQQLGRAAQRGEHVAGPAAQVDHDLARPVAARGEPPALEVLVAVAELQVLLRPFGIAEIEGVGAQRLGGFRDVRRKVLLAAVQDGVG